MKLCGCHSCRLWADKIGLAPYPKGMIGCQRCGNKRCPHATNCDLPCTESNEPGQPGSRYTTPPSED